MRVATAARAIARSCFSTSIKAVACARIKGFRAVHSLDQNLGELRSNFYFAAPVLGPGLSRVGGHYDIAANESPPGRVRQRRSSCPSPRTRPLAALSRKYPYTWWKGRCSGVGASEMVVYFKGLVKGDPRSYNRLSDLNEFRLEWTENSWCQ